MLRSTIGKAKILIVDDEQANVRLLERILELIGATRIQSTCDSREAMAQFLDFRPDLVLLDLHMPNVTGFDIMEQIKALTTGENPVPVLVLTADVTTKTKHRALAAGAKDFLTKPLDQSEVLLRIRNLLENRFLHIQLQNQNILLEEQVRERTSQLEDTLLKLRTDLFAYLQSLPLKFHDARRSSDSSFRVAYDSQSIQTIYNRGFTNIFNSAVTLVSIFFVMLRIDGALTALSVAVVPAIMWAVHYFSLRIRQQSTSNQEM